MATSNYTRISRISWVHLDVQTPSVGTQYFVCTRWDICLHTHLRVLLRDTDGTHPGYRRMEDVRTDGFCLYVLFYGLLGTHITPETSVRTNTVCTPQLTEVQTNQLVGTDKWAPPSVRQKRRVQTKYSVLQFSKGFGYCLCPHDTNGIYDTYVHTTIKRHLCPIGPLNRDIRNL